MFRHFYHADPDLLLTCKNNIDFSKIVSDIYIDGVWKTTNVSRLENTDDLILDLLKKNNSQKPCRFMDLGVSSGVTSIELAKKIAKVTKIPIKYFLIDRYFYLLRYIKNGFVEYRTSDEKPVFLKYSHLGIRLPVSEHKHSFLSNMIASLYLGFSGFRKKMILDCKLPLFESSLLLNDTYEMIEQDCLDIQLPENLKFKYIRASNILNKAYFSDDQIKNSINILKNHLEEEGFLIISRNTESKNMGKEIISVWVLKDEKLELFSTFNGGSEIDDLLVGL